MIDKFGEIQLMYMLCSFIFINMTSMTNDCFIVKQCFILEPIRNNDSIDVRGNKKQTNLIYHSDLVV